MSEAGSDPRIRIAKILAQRGIASRSEADRMIERGWVAVDGVVAQSGDRALPDAQIVLSPEASAVLGDSFTIILNKPRGFVSAEDETGGARAMGLLVPGNYVGAGAPPATHRAGLRIAGRLSPRDRGLVIYTTDSALARRLAADDIGEGWQIAGADLPEAAAQQIVDALAAVGKRAVVTRHEAGSIELDSVTLGKAQLSSLCRDLGFAVMVTRCRRGNIALPADLPEARWTRIEPSAQP